ncbi:MAG: hypothetical protein RLY21_1518 [Planctomycetota bacterium]
MRAVALTAVLVFVPGCQNRKVKVEISAQGDEATRTFATNDTNSKALAAVEQAYGAKAQSDTELGARFTGTFAEDMLPSEIGNRGAIGRLDSTLGSTRAYYEQFADRRDEWTAMKDRVDSGILWMQLFGRFVETRKIKDDAARAEFSKWWNAEAIPLVSDAYLMYSGMQAVVQAQRIGARPRRSEEFGERTEDETFRLSVFEPLAILFAERGWLNADEFAALQAAGVKGTVTRREGEWLSEKILQPAIARILVRFDPSRKDMKLKDFVPLALEFVVWLKASREYRDLVLVSPAISEQVKTDIRAGKWDFELPPPFGFRALERPKVTDAEVVLATGAEPFFTNGVWNKDTNRVEFKGGFYEAKYRYAPYNSPYYAFWSLPSQRQESVFGAVLLEGDTLAQYCAWENALSDERKTQWVAALDALASTKDANPAYLLISELSKEHPVPIPLAKWVSAKAEKELPEVFLSEDERKARDAKAKTEAGAAATEAATAPAGTSTKG